MKRDFDLIVYGATGYTGRLIAEYLATSYRGDDAPPWAIAGRSTDKLQRVRADIGAPDDLPLVRADAAEPASLRSMCERAAVIITTVGPYQFHGPELVAACAAVAINYRARTDEANKLAEDLRKTGVHVATVQADISLAEAVSKMVDTAKSELGTIDILINNAGIAITRGIDDLSETDFDRTIATNLKSVFLCTQAVLPMMRAKKWGRIVNISSGAARGAGAIGPHYNASKAGVEGLTRGYAARLVKEGITVNAVAPSLIETEMMKGQENLVSRIPLGRFGKADEVARAVMMLVDNPYMTGQTVAMSGGMTFN